jgi:hypothetical protein
MPTIQDLPNELLLETLSYLNYPDLQNCLQATKTLRAIAYHPALDHKLFRSKVVKHKHDNMYIDTIIVHPVFDRVFFTNMRILPGAHVSRYTNEFFHTGIPVIQDRVHSENITSPPVSYITFGTKVLENKDKSAITVGQVLNELTRLYQMSIFRHEHESHAHGLRIGCVRRASASHDDKKTHIEVECKDVQLVALTGIGSRRSFMMTRSNGAAFLGANCGDQW